MSLFEELLILYDTLEKQGKIQVAWDFNGKVDYGIDLNDDGTIFQLINFKIDNKPKIMTIPAYAKKDNGEKFKYFLCASSKFLLGYKSKLTDKSKHAEYFNTIADYSINLLNNINTLPSNAIKNFFNRYKNNIDQLHADLNLTEENEKIYSGQKYIICYNGISIFEYDEIKEIWNTEYYNTIDTKNLSQGCSIISGNKGLIAKIHPGIPLSGGSAMPSLISCKADCESFQSYGFTEGINAHITTEDMIKYRTALIYLIKNKEHYNKISDLHILSWSKTNNDAYTNLFNTSLLNDLPIKEESNTNTLQSNIHQIFNSIEKNEVIEYNNIKLNTDEQFYILGLVVNGGRVAVKFFIENSFGYFIKNIKMHYDRMTLPNNKFSTDLSVYQICNETVRDGDDFPDVLATQVFSSSLNNTRYPDSLLLNILTRVKKEFGKEDKKTKKEIKIATRKIQILKMILSKNYENINKEEIYMLVENGSLSYQLGRLFATCEKIQEDTNTNKNIGSAYFSSSMTSPAKAFPQVIQSARLYLPKLNEGKQIFYNKLIQSIIENIDNFPTHLNNIQQGEFCLGYYHQRQDFFTKKDKNENNKSEEAK